MSIQPSRSTRRCPRCGGALDTWKMSIFNTDEICLPCATDETQAPGFERAQSAETAEVLKGNHTYSGIGLSEKDRAFLRARLTERRQRTNSQ